MRVGVLGGTFNPIHFGHLRAAQETAEAMGFDKVLFVPSGAPALKSTGLASPQDRAQMVRLAVQGNALFEFSDIELQSTSASYTVDTMDALRASRPGDELWFILGLDAFMELHLWRDPERLVRDNPMVVIARPGRGFMELGSSPYLDAPQAALERLSRGQSIKEEVRLKGGGRATLLAITALHISATHIRALIREGRSARYLLPAPVESFIINNHMYVEPEGPRPQPCGRRGLVQGQ